MSDREQGYIEEEEPKRKTRDEKRAEKNLTPEAEDVLDPDLYPNEAIDSDYCGDIDDLCKQLLKRKQEYADDRVIQDPFYFEAVAWMSNRQYYEWSPSQGKLTFNLPDYQKQIRITINRIVGKVRNVVAKMVSNSPYSDVMPNSPGDDDKFAARCGQNLLKHSAFKKYNKMVKRRFAWAVVVFGHAWIKTTWNKYGGVCKIDFEKQGVVLDDGTPKMNGDQQEMEDKVDENGKKVKNKLWSGEAVREVITPLKMYYDISTEDWEKAHDCFTVDYWSIDRIKMSLPNCEDVSEADSEHDAQNPWQMMFEYIVDRQSGGNRHGLSVIDYYAKASLDFPEGLHVTIVKDTIRVAEPLDTLEGDRLPFSHAKYIDIGTMRGMGLPELLKPLQYCRNKVISQQIENFKQMLNGRIWLRAGTQLGDITTNQVGQFIEWGPMGIEKPVVEIPTPLPSTAYELVKLFDADFDNVSGITRVAEGTSLPEVNSGDQVEALAENAQQVHNPEINEVQDAWCDSDHLELRYTQTNMPDEMAINLLGPDGRYLHDKFKGSMIKNNWNTFLRPSSAANLSRSAKRKELEMLLQVVANAQVDPQTKRVIVDKAIDFIQWGEEDAFVEELERDSNAAMDTILDIKEGKVPDPMKIVMPFWDLDMWRNEIEKVLLSSDFKNKWQPPAKDNLMKLWIAVHQKQIERLQPPPGSATMPGNSTGNPTQPPGGPKPPGSPPVPGPNGPPPQGAS